jgi:integrase
MSTRRERVPSYRLHKPSGQAVVTLNGQDHYLGRFETQASRDAYNQLIVTWLSHGRSLPLQQQRATVVCVAQVCDVFLKWAKAEYRNAQGEPSREVANIELALRPLVHGNFAALPASQFGAKALIAFRDELIRSGLARKTINQRVGIVRRAFRHAVTEEIVPPGTLHALQAVHGLKRGRCNARESEGVKPVPPADIEAVLPRLPAPVAAMVRMQLLTGCRPGEVVAMRLADIDRTNDVWIYRPSAHKNAWRGHRREVHIGPQAQEILRQFIRPGCDELPLFSPTEAERRRWDRLRKSRTTPRWASHVRVQQERYAARSRRKLNDRYSVVTYGQAIRRACAPGRGAAASERRAVAPWSPGRLRHNAATEIRRRFGLEVAAAVLGHAKVETTQIYAEVNQERACEVIRQIG